MASFEIAQLLEPVSPDEPCGPDLSYDAALMELEQLVQGKEGGGIVATEELPGQEPDYKEVKRRSIELLGRTKHLRLGVYLTLAATRLDGAEALRDGLALLRGMVEQHWDHVHPQLDPDDDNDPTERLNILVAMATPVGTYGDPLRFQLAVREAPLTESRQLGRFSARDIAIAAGRAQAPDGAKPADAATVEAAFKDTDPLVLQARAQALDEAIAHVKSIEDALTERVGINQAIDLSNLVTTLREVKQELASRMPLSMQAAATEAPAGDAEQTAELSGLQSNGRAAPPQAISGEINSREDVVRMLDKITDYYARYEPSSPLPLLLGRAKRLVHLDFMDILHDLSPDTLQQVTTIMGIDSKKG